MAPVRMGSSWGCTKLELIQRRWVRGFGAEFEPNDFSSPGNMSPCIYYSLSLLLSCHLDWGITMQTTAASNICCHNR